MKGSAFEPPVTANAHNVAPRVAPPAPARFEGAALPKKLPRAIMLDEPIGWNEGGVLCMFKDQQVVTNPTDIKRLIERGAQYAVINHE